MEWSLRGPLSELYLRTPPVNQNCRISRLSFNMGPYGKIFKNLLLKLVNQLRPNFVGMVRRWSPFRIVSNDPACQPRWPPWLKIENLAKKSLKIFSLETTWPVWTKLWWNSLGVVPFQDCIRWPHMPTKTTDTSRHGFKIGPYGKNV